MPLEFAHFTWGLGYGRVVADLTDRENIRTKALELREKIARFRHEEPQKEIYIVAKSAGTAVALGALAALERDVVERVVLLSPAVSPVFPLAPSLKAVRRDLISFWSPFDFLHLGIGTSLFGSADGVRGKSAGLAGFDLSLEANEEDKRELAKLREIKWQTEMISSLNRGDHSGTSMPLFLQRYVLPLLRGESL
jgi:pimeloyl-ACP methyl ester carboxylesterase